jgi:undecaprenyl-diphosphatase
MAEWLQAVLLGLVQGLTEFLPVSSSGHLVLAQKWLGDDFLAASDPVFFDLVLHMGTLVPIFWFYRVELRGILGSPFAGPRLSEAGGLGAWLRGNESRWLAAMVVVGSVPTAAIGLGFQDVFEDLFSTVGPVCIALMVTGALLIATRFAAQRDQALALTLIGALLIGTIQGIAIIPGISRSGSTIALALFLGLDRGLAARFSFLLSVPAILGAMLLVLARPSETAGVGPGALQPGSIDWLPLFCGFASAAIVGYLALALLVGIVKKGGLHRFAWYLFPAAVLAWLTLRC